MVGDCLFEVEHSDVHFGVDPLLACCEVGVFFKELLGRLKLRPVDDLFSCLVKRKSSMYLLRREIVSLDTKREVLSMA